MKREKNLKTAKFIEALEHIDPKYVEEAGKKIKERQTGQTVSGMSRAKSLRQVLALVACVLLLSAVIPAVTYLMGHLPDILGSSTGDNTTEQTAPETPPEETTIPTPETTVTETTLEETTAPETTAPETTAEETTTEETTAEETTAEETTAPPEPEHDGSRGLEYRIEGDHAVLVGIGTCTDKEIAVASTYDGLPVTAIGRRAIYSLDGITRVVIPDTVTHLDFMAISHCHDLESIHIPANLTVMEESAIIAFKNLKSITVDPNNPRYYSINNCLIDRETKTLILGCGTSIFLDDVNISAIAPNAFMECTAIESIRIPEGVTKIGRDAFYNCTALKSLVLPESLITIESSAFANCTSLESVNLGSKIEYMDIYAFSECVKLTEIVLPDSLSFLGNYAFQGCTALKRAVLSSNLETLDLMIFSSCTNLESVIIPEGVKTIGADTFSSTALKEITLPASIIKIERDAFGNCDSLMSVSFAGTVAQWIAIEKNLGWHTVGTFKVIRCSDGEVKLYSDSKDGGSIGLEYEITTDGKSVRLIGEGFCTDAKIVVTSQFHGLPVTEIYSVALSSCDFIEEIVIPESVTVIRNQAFGRCVNLKKITLPSTLEYIYDSAFADCESLESIVIPRKVKLIDTWAFRDCKNLTEFTFAGTVAKWNAVRKGTGNNWNEDCPFTVIHCSDGDVYLIESDGSRGLEYRIEGDHAVLVGIGTCTDKDIVTATTYNGLPVTGIDSFEISGNKGITSVTVSEGVTHIEVCAFSGCPDLRAVYLPSTLQFLSAGEGIAFENCDNIDTITVADSNPKYYSVGNCLIERETGNLVFACSKSVLPTDGSIKSIGQFAFGGSDSLEGIVIPEGVTVIHPYAFAGCASLKSVTFPDSLTTVRWDAFANCTSLESVKLGDNVTEIGSRVFSGCSSLVDVTLPRRVDSFGEEIFAGCPIESIVIPDGVKTLHGGMFANCKNLKNVTLPDGIETIVGFAFAYCSSLEKITLPRSVTKIQGEAFADCSNLTEFTFKGTKAEWNTIEKQDRWNEGCPFTVVHCSDGDVDLIEYDGSRGLEYKIDGDHAVLVGIGTCTDKEIIVASTYNGLPVTSVDYSFSKISNVTSITLSDSVLTVGGIDNMPDLVKVYFSKSVEGINPESLIGCPNLVVIEVDKDNHRYMSAGNCLIEKATKTIVHGCKGSVIPSDGSVTAIGEFSFHGCDWLTELTVPKNIERIDSYAFAGCDNLKKVILPDSLTYLGFGAFAFCESLESVTFGKNLETIGGSVFEDCPKLRELHFPRTLKFLGSLALDRCYSLSKVSFAGTVREWNAIEKTWMWYGGERLFNVIHCSNGDVDIIDESDGSQGLEYRIDGDHAILVGIGTCKDREIVTATYYEGLPVTEIDDFAFESVGGFTSITVSEGVTSIGLHAFANCPDLREIYLPSTLDDIYGGEGIAFFGCDALEVISVAENNPKYYSAGNCLIERDTKTIVFGCKNSKIPSGGSVDKIGYFAFSGISLIKEIVIPEGITEIMGSAFSMCKGVEKVTLPKSLKKIDGGAFSSCSSLESIEVGNNVTDIGSSAFAGCTKLKNVTLPKRLDYLGEGVFASTAIESIVIPEGIKELYGGMFANCRNLKSVSLPAGLERIGGSDFSQCFALESIIIPEGVTEIGAYTFSSCTNLKEITLPASLTTIDYSAFANCTSLESISLPAAVTEIGHDAFRGSTALTEFVFGGDAAAWNSIKKDANWRTETGIEIIKCSDREVDAGYTQPDYSNLSSVPEVYRNIIENKTAFYYCPTGKEIFLDDIVFLFSTREEKITESEVRYSVLDMNGDGDLELVVTNLFDVLVFNDEGGTVYCYMLRKNNGWVREIAVDGTFEWREPGYDPAESSIIGRLEFGGTNCKIVEVYRRTNVGSLMEPSYEYYVNKRRVSEGEAKEFRNTIAIDLVCQYLIDRYPLVKE